MITPKGFIDLRATKHQRPVLEAVCPLCGDTIKADHNNTMTDGSTNQVAVAWKCSGCYGYGYAVFRTDENNYARFITHFVEASYYRLSVMLPSMQYIFNKIKREASC